MSRPMSLALMLAVATLAADATAAVSLYLSPERLAARSPLVVEGTVTRVASGFDPQHQTLATYVTIDVQAVHRGPDRVERVVLREQGGRHGPLLQVVDAAPRYRAGERVLAFLEPAADGALRTSGMFFGRFEVRMPERGPALAVRRLEGRVLGRASREAEETFPLGDLVATAVALPSLEKTRRSRGPSRVERGDRDASSSAVIPWQAEPPEIDRLVWDAVSGHDPRLDPLPRPSAGTLAADGSSGTAAGRFAPLEAGTPARWNEVDAGRPLVLQVRPEGNPLGDSAGAVGEVARAMAAWTGVPESRVELRVGEPPLDGSGGGEASPARVYTGVDLVLFGDPYDDIPDPEGCSGVLAIGGYWRTSSSDTVVNGVRFAALLQGWVIFNDAFECFLGDPDNLAEVAAHELGHALGFGHSGAPDSILRAWAWGRRGPRLGDDDRDAAHCHYPHRLRVVSPNGGESLPAGSMQRVLWESSPEAGNDPGSVDIELSLDGGASWSVLAEGVANDGVHEWTAPRASVDSARLRVVRRTRLEPRPPYPPHCSGDASDGTFAITDGEAVEPLPPVPAVVDDHPRQRRRELRR